MMDGWMDGRTDGQTDRKSGIEVGAPSKNELGLESLIFRG